MAQDKGEVQAQFKGYQDVLAKYKISQKDIWNFDETGFRVGCLKGQQIYMPLDIKEVYYCSNYKDIILIVYIVVLTKSRKSILYNCN